jgi:hypothetical protein
MKPSHLDGCASDDEVNLEDDLPYGADIKVNSPIVKVGDLKVQLA